MNFSAHKYAIATAQCYNSGRSTYLAQSQDQICYSITIRFQALMQLYKSLEGFIFGYIYRPGIVVTRHLYNKCIDELTVGIASYHHAATQTGEKLLRTFTALSAVFSSIIATRRGHQ